ncbi:hypothetical protein C2G38_2232187 [Gigaspora rosea]|uniref:Uncharacterized protein n=1 Tax=Gigaspora rosea TaxID=44941 RepID=A0A397TW97_9GLOM|nr:hypothetical protein C2G38_2232187 [Gigaspora rosea]
MHILTNYYYLTAVLIYRHLLTEKTQRLVKDTSGNLNVSASLNRISESTKDNRNMLIKQNNEVEYNESLIAEREGEIREI